MEDGICSHDLDEKENPTKLFSVVNLHYPSVSLQYPLGDGLTKDSCSDLEMQMVAEPSS